MGMTGGLRAEDRGVNPLPFEKCASRCEPATQSHSENGPSPPLSIVCPPPQLLLFVLCAHLQRQKMFDKGDGAYFSIVSTRVCSRVVSKSYVSLR